MNKDRLITLSLIVLAAALSRLLPHPANVAPITGLALFAGAQFERKELAFVLPFLALLLSDMIIGFYPQMWITYLAFATIVCIGFKLRGHVKPLPVLGASLAGSVVFFLITNFALLPFNDLYPKTMGGVIESYTMALPFFMHTLLGDLFYTGLLFGGFALAERKYSKLRVA